MVEGTEERKASQDRRLRLKTQEHQLKTLAVEGAGLSPWEAEVLVDMVREVFCGDPADRPLAPGQMRYTCVAASEGAGKPIEHCQTTTVVVTMLEDDDFTAGGPSRLRQRRIVRLVEQFYPKTTHLRPGQVPWITVAKDEAAQPRKIPVKPESHE